MKCEDMPQNLVSLLYKDLGSEETREVKAHLSRCASCRREFEELQQTSSLLSKWEDANPGMNLVFVHEPAGFLKRWRESWHRWSWAGRLAAAVPACAAVILLFLSAVNFRAQSSNGRWDVSFSLLPRRSEMSQEQLKNTLAEFQKETLMLTSRLIDDSEIRINQNHTSQLTRLAQDMERQRIQDLLLIGQGMEGIQQTTQQRFNQTSDILNRMIRLTNYNPADK